MTLKLSHPLILLPLLAGCFAADSPAVTDDEPGPIAQSRMAAPSQEKTYTSIHGDSRSCLEGAPLCELLRKPGTTYGLYRVKALTGRSEQTPQGDHKSMTFVTLERVAGPGPEAPVARLRGGPLPGGGDTPGPVSLTVDEVVGLVLRKPALSQWYTFSTPDVFHKIRPRVFASPYEEVAGSDAEFLAKLEQVSERGCPPPPPAPPSPEGQPAIVTDVVDEEVAGTSVSL